MGRSTRRSKPSWSVARAALSPIPPWTSPSPTAASSSSPRPSGTSGDESVASSPRGRSGQDGPGGSDWFGTRCAEGAGGGGAKGGPGRSPLFRYETRRWSGGSTPDASEAVSSPVRVANDLARAQRVLDLVPSVPTPVWGRDELHTGDMWDSHSLISWLLVRAGVATDRPPPPSGGRGPRGG